MLDHKNQHAGVTPSKSLLGITLMKSNGAPTQKKTMEQSHFCTVGISHMVSCEHGRG